MNNNVFVRFSPLVISNSTSVFDVASSLNSVHIASGSVNASRSPRDRYFCTHCKVRGHSKERCFKLNGYLSGYKPKPRTTTFSLAQVHQTSGPIELATDGDSSTPQFSLERYMSPLALLNSQS